MTHRPSPQADGDPGIATIPDIVTAVLCDQLGLEPEEVLPGLSLVDDLGADSLDLVSIALDLEERCGLPPVSDADMTALRVVADVIAYVERHTAAERISG